MWSITMRKRKLYIFCTPHNLLLPWSSSSSLPRRPILSPGLWTTEISTKVYWNSVQFCSVAQSCPTLCDFMNHSTPGLPVHHQLPEPTQTPVHWVSDAIQPSRPLLSPPPPALNLLQHQGLFKWVSSLHQVAKVLAFQLRLLLLLLLSQFSHVQLWATP